MANTAQAQATPTTTNPVQRWLARSGAGALFIRQQHKGLPWDPAGFSKEDGFVFSKQQVARYA
jgi:hypothetical protein